ncbi:type II toxin-antitoxin system RelB family antitoxin [Corynebacterium jeddahense]|uniref:type II toxin-antitoxin system RelB family antitoxin n=1 Tax=Corynebacterium jeddahense TaxID=1414719 RepID=UPI0005A8FCEC|nr:DUF6290 family protein [Corynebacterium jeddahense]
MFLKIRLSSEEAPLLAEFARSEGMTVSEFARTAIMEKVEDLQDVEELRAALESDSGERFTADEICRELGC